MEVRVRAVRSDATVPRYMSAGAAGADLTACLPAPVTIAPGESRGLPTGVALEIPAGFAGLVCARSGLATQRGLAPTNKVGVIDSDYRGEICIWLRNQSQQNQTIQPGERIAQILFVKVPQAQFVVCKALSETPRGGSGFGSTGL